MKTIESKPILRPYQEACIEAVTGALARGLTRVYYVLPTGSGKTVIFVSLIDRLLKPGHPALVIAHREELLTQARESILRANPHLSVGIERADCRAPRTCDVVVASIQTIGRKGSTRMEWLRNVGPSCIIVDECFPSGTLVDGTPIERLKAGTPVRSFCHDTGSVEMRPVVRTMRNRCKALVRVWLSNGTQIVCTPNHPLAFISQNGEVDYVPAELSLGYNMVCNTTLYQGDNYELPVQKLRGLRKVIPIKQLGGGSQDILLLGRMPEDKADEIVENRFKAMRRVWENCRASWTRGFTTVWQQAFLLRGRMQESVLCENLLGDDGTNKSQICQPSHESQKPDVRPDSQRKGLRVESATGLATACSGRQRQNAACSSTVNGVNVGVADGGGGKNRISSWIDQRHAEPLQDRHCERDFENSDRGRWGIPPKPDTSRTRRTQNGVLSFARVDRVKVLEPGSDGTFGGLCADGHVYNIEVEGNHNYFVNDTLVHNCHHIAADGYGRAIDFMTTLNPLIPVIGCTATPSRLDKIALHGAKGAVFQDCVYSYPIRQAIDDGYLCQLRGYRVAVVDCDLSKVKVVAGDYSAKSLAEAINVEARTVKAMEHWREHCQDRQTIVFCADVAHAESAAKVWADAGYATACVTGAMDTEDRRRTLAAYKQHKLQVLCNCQVLTEGYDNPATSAIVMLRPTKSWALYCQCIGRGTRIHPDKDDLVVIDVVDNSAEHRLDEMPEANLVKPKTPRGTGQEDASVSTLLGLPAGIDLEGHTVTEIANLKDQLTMESALFERYRPETYSDLVTMIEKVDLFAGLTQGEVKAAIPAARYAWVQRGQDWVLNVKDGTATIRRDADGQWWVRVVTPDADPHIMALRTQDVGDAIAKAERIAEGLIENLGMARVDARWRNDKPSEGQLGLLRRWGIAPAMIAAMSKGEASAFITRKFASRGR